MASLALQSEIPVGSTSVAADFEGLVQQVLGGDESAWTAFVARVHPTVLAICRRRRFVGGPGDPEDTGRDVALRAPGPAKSRRFRGVARLCSCKEDA